MNNQTTNPVFHGSDIEKISACYHIKKEAIVNFAGCRTVRPADPG